MSLPSGVYAPVEISYRDAGNEIGTQRFFGIPIDVSDTAGNIEEAEAAWTAYLSAADAMTLGARTKDRYFNEALYATTQPTNGAARETKLLIQFQDSVTGKRYTTTLPTLDPTLPHYVINVNVKDGVLITEPTAMTNLVTAFQNLARAPETGNTVVVIGAQVVGRSI